MVYSAIETTCFGLYWPQSLCSPKKNTPSPHRREDFSLFIIFSPCLQIAPALGTEGSGD